MPIYLEHLMNAYHLNQEPVPILLEQKQVYSTEIQNEYKSYDFFDKNLTQF